MEGGKSCTSCCSWVSYYLNHGRIKKKNYICQLAKRRGIDARDTLKIKMARIQRRFSETAFEMFAIFTKLPSLYILRRFRMTVVNMMS